MKLHEALDPTMAKQVLPELKALRKVDCKKIRVGACARLSGSLDLDSSMRGSQPQASRWDYIIGKVLDERNDEAIYLEIHPADSHGVDEVLRKLSWLMDWIQTQPGMIKLKSARYVWVASGEINIQKSTPQWRRLAQSRIKYACFEGVCRLCEIN